MGPFNRSSDRVRSLTLAFAALLFAASALVDAGPLIFEERTKVTVPGPTDQLTIGVGLSGDFMIVATRRNFDDPPGTTVSEQFAYLFQRSSATGQWAYLSTLVQRRDPHATAPPFAVAMEGNVAVVKAADLHVFELLPTLGWAQTAQLPTRALVDVDIADGTILTDGTSCAWEAWRKNAANQWVRAGGVGPDPSNCTYGSNDVSGDTVVVGHSQSFASSIHAYSPLSATSPTIIPSPLGTQDVYFGAAVALHRNTLLTTSALWPGVLNLRRTAPGVWDYLARVAPADAYMDPNMLNVPYLEISRALSNTFATTAFPFDNHRGLATGSVPVFFLGTDSTMSEIARLYASDSPPETLLGTYTAIDGQRIAASARNGSVYVFELPTTLRQTEVIQETFQGGNAANWTPIAGSSFSVVTAGNSRVYRQSSLAGASGSYPTSMDWQDQSIQVDVRPTAFDGVDRWFGLAVRRTDANNYYYVTVRSSNVIELKRIRNGAFVTLASAPLAVRLNRNYRLRLEAVGTWIRAFVNGQLVVQARDTMLTHGHAGLQLYKTRADYDNVVITPNHQLALFTDNFDLTTKRWTVVDGTWALTYDDTTQTSTYRQTSLGGGARTFTGVPTEDQVLQVKARALAFGGTNVWFGAAVRYIDNRNYYYVTLRNNGTLSLRKLQNGAIFVLGTRKLTVTPGTTYDLRLEAIGSSLRAYINGKLQLEANDSTFTKGGYALAMYNTSAEYDELRVAQP